MGSDDDERDLVRRGYDQLSYLYRPDDAEDGQYGPWLADLHQRLPGSSTVLDLGCGCGIPVARYLADARHRVTGVDISDVQIDWARRLVPLALSCEPTPPSCGCPLHPLMRWSASTL